MEEDVNLLQTTLLGGKMLISFPQMVFHCHRLLFNFIFCHRLVSTLLHCGKSKDSLAARKDMEELGIRQNLHPRVHGKRTYLPPAPWSLSKAEKNIFCRRLFDFKGPDEYCSNISRGVSLDDVKSQV